MMVATAISASDPNATTPRPSSRNTSVGGAVVVVVVLVLVVVDEVLVGIVLVGIVVDVGDVVVVGPDVDEGDTVGGIGVTPAAVDSSPGSPVDAITTATKTSTVMAAKARTVRFWVEFMMRVLAPH